MDDSGFVGQENEDISNHWDFEALDENEYTLTSTDESNNNSSVTQNDIIKNGPVLISCKNGLGLYSWRRRWLVLNKRAIVFFKRDPNILSGGQVNLILGGILLKKSGSFKVREDKKLLTVTFPDALDRRAFTFKTETLEDLQKWRAALELALQLAPVTPCSPSLIGSFWQFMSGIAKPAAKSQKVRRTLSRALKHTDEKPSLLEKALCFLENFGTKVEGILRISADLGEVQRRIKDFEEGNTEFDAKEDAHVVADCFKHILRELQSSVVPARCCSELVKAFDTYEGDARIDALRKTIFKNLPESNRLLFQRILKMLYTICCTPENRMSPAAVAACMAPLLLRPILDGECNLMDETDFINDDSSQLFGIAFAAKTAQGIIALILEEYHNIFNDENSNRYSVSVDSEEDPDNENSTDEYSEVSCNEEPRRSSSFRGSDLYDETDLSSNLRLSDSCDLASSERNASQLRKSQDHYEKGVKKTHVNLFCTYKALSNRKPNQSFNHLLSRLKPISPPPETCQESSPEEPKRFSVDGTLTSHWETESTKKISSAEKQLEEKKTCLQQSLREEANVNASLQGSLEKKKQDLIERYLILNEHVEKLHEKLQTENNLPLMTEVGRSRRISSANLSDQERMTGEEEDDENEEFPHQLSLLQLLCGSSSDAPKTTNTYQNIQNATLETLLRDFDANLTFQETLAELSIQPVIFPPIKPRGKSGTSSNSKTKKGHSRSSEEHRRGTESIVSPFKFDKI